MRSIPEMWYYNTKRFTATETVNTIMNARSAAIMS